MIMIEQEALTDQEIVNLANELARSFYSIRGYDVPEGYRFDKAHHPQEQECWRMSVIAFDMLRQTDVENALCEIEEEEESI